jgi:hypothetical protein
MLAGYIQADLDMSVKNELDVKNPTWNAYKLITKQKGIKSEQWKPILKFVSENAPEDEFDSDCLDAFINNLKVFVKARQMWVHKKSSLVETLIRP